jgi:hypothetical protein
MFCKQKPIANRTRIFNNGTTKNKCFDEYAPIKNACLKMLCIDYVKNIKSKKAINQKIKKHKELRKLFDNGINGMHDPEFTQNILFQIDKRLKDDKNETI